MQFYTMKNQNIVSCVKTKKNGENLELGWE